MSVGEPVVSASDTCTPLLDVEDDERLAVG
jgi:hypothetical protein